MLCLNFLWRPLFDAFLKVLAPGGLHGLDRVSYTEGWTEEGRHEARLVARA